MSTDFNAIRERMERLQGTQRDTATKPRIDYDAIRFKVALNKQTVRIFPIKGQTYPFVEVEVYPKIPGDPKPLFNVVSPSFLGEVDPVGEFRKSLYLTKDPAQKEIAKQFQSRRKFVAFVLTRTEESRLNPQLKIWEFGSDTMQQLMSLFFDDDNNEVDYVDLERGYDLVITGAKMAKPSGDGDYIGAQRIDRSSKGPSPALENLTHARELIDNQMSPLTLFYNVSVDKFNTIAENWIRRVMGYADTTDEDDIPSHSSTPKPVVPAAGPVQVPTGSATTTATGPNLKQVPQINTPEAINDSFKIVGDETVDVDDEISAYFQKRR